MKKNQCIGIDLGTSNSAVALSSAEGEGVEIVDITQLESPNAVGERRLLPSAIYIPLNSERNEGIVPLPWQHDESPDDESPERRDIVGAFARSTAATAPDRVVTSVKSWLCNRHVDRKENILPWKSELSDDQKYSPYEGSLTFLKHAKQALEFSLRARSEQFIPSESEVVLTVPASFDEVARSLTHEAAAAAGWEEVTLLEEPQAAFYAWLNQHEHDWRELVHPGDLILVCDVGGGTADFSLIAVSEQQGNLSLERISVGEHILLGGDNMDLALAYAVKNEMEEQGTTIDHWQFLSLTHSARSAKEKLFADPTLQEIPISLPSRGASLFASTVSTKMTRAHLEGVVLHGFFPITQLSEMPTMRQGVGLQEFGLDYAADPVLSRHLARFLVRSLANVRSDETLRHLIGEQRCAEEASALLPSAVLFNGGVFNAAPLRSRVMELLHHWSGGEAVRELVADNLDLAVARGACRYAQIRAQGEGIRIKAGTARSYYIGVEGSMPAVPGMKPPLNGVCIVPQGTEEGTSLVLDQREFGLVTGEQVEFRFFSSEVRAGDAVGTTVERAPDQIEESSRLQLRIPLEGESDGEVVPVKLHGVVSELGVLELWMHHTASEKRWKLEFNVRGSAAS